MRGQTDRQANTRTEAAKTIPCFASSVARAQVIMALNRQLKKKTRVVNAHANTISTRMNVNLQYTLHSLIAAVVIKKLMAYTARSITPYHSIYFQRTLEKYP